MNHSDLINQFIAWYTPLKCEILSPPSNEKNHPILSPKTKKGGEMGRIPLNIVMHENYAAKSIPGMKISKEIQNQTQLHRHRSLFLTWLTWERFEKNWSEEEKDWNDWKDDESSWWFPYLNFLPKKFDDPLHWSKEELEWLRGTNLFEWTRLRRQEVEMEWKWCKERVGDWLTLDKWLWAYSVVYSRSFPSSLHPFGTDDVETTEKQVVLNKSLTNDDHQSIGFALLPVLDMFNHSPKANVEWNLTNDFIVFHSNDELIEGKEVFNNYGPKSTEELIAGYGFVNLDHHLDYYTIVVNPNSDKDPLWSKRSRYLDGSFRHFLKKDNVESLLRQMYYLCMNEKELENGNVSKRCEYLTLTTLIDLLESKLKMLEVDVGQDLESYRWQMADFYRRGQVEIVKSCLEVCEKNKEALSDNVLTLEKILEHESFQHLIQGCEMDEVMAFSFYLSYFKPVPQVNDTDLDLELKEELEVVWTIVNRRKKVSLSQVFSSAVYTLENMINDELVFE